MFILTLEPYRGKFKDVINLLACLRPLNRDILTYISGLEFIFYIFIYNYIGDMLD
jgi:hypothetical protein